MKQETAVFHAGEKAIQQRANVPDNWTETAAKFFRSAMPQQHQEFFAKLPFLFLGTLDTSGRVWAVPVFGKPGDLCIATPDKLKLHAIPAVSEQLSLDLSKGTKLGVLGIEPHTRRRNRMNGVISEASEIALTVQVDLSFGNCPKYIQKREFNWDAKSSAIHAAQRLEVFSQEAAAILKAADTFFIASRSAEFSKDPSTGIDVSHRGGMPGFLSLNANGTLSFPDFSGNRLFNTLGNIHTDGRVGLFVPNFETGTALYLSGRASIDWDEARIASFPDAQRIIDVKPEELWLVEHAWPASVFSE